VNLSDKTVQVIIQFTSPIEQLKNNDTRFRLQFADTILKINDKTAGFLNLRLNYNQINYNTVTIDIPKHSTVLIGGTYNRPIAADSIKIVIEGNIREFSSITVSKYLKKTGGLFPPFHFTYTIDD